MKPWPALILMLCACSTASSGSDTDTSAAGTTEAASETATEATSDAPTSSTSAGGSSTGDAPDLGSTTEPPLSCEDYDDELAALTQALEQALVELEIPGAALAVRFPDSVICTREAGLANIPEALELGPEHLWRMGSITKTVVAGLVMRAVEDGLVALDDPITDHVLADEAGLLDVTVRQLLTHQSGVPSYTDPSAIAFWTAWEADPQRAWDPYELVAYAWEVADGSCFAPGAGWSYSNTNYVILGILLEELRGADLEDQIAELAASLELDAFFLDDAASPDALLARGYLDDPEAALCTLLGEDAPYVEGLGLCDATESLHPSIAGASGALVATPAATVAWLDAFVDGALFEPALLPEVADFQDTYPAVGACPGGAPFLRYGLGLLEWTTSEDAVLIGHNGVINGYQALAVRSPEHDFTLSVTLNRGAVDVFAVGERLLAALGL